ncbi:MAG TPA: amino acid adenylation domain-containing protein [Thermoanaerobaculia bacterium]|nr:amino acid adenylation domain-containing protein [Thermoanaerobaculia bacterium]
MSEKKLVHDLFREAAGRFGSSVAIDGPRACVTYAELEERSNRLAALLREGGLQTGDRVAVLAEDRAEVIAALLACLKARCVWVPLDPDLPVARLAGVARQAGPAAWVVEAAFRPLLRELAPDAPRVVSAGEDMLAAEPFELASEPDDMAYLVFTSGSTGEPKGIAGRLKGIGHFVRWEIEALGLGPGNRVSQLTTPSFDAFLRDVFTPLLSGGTVCVPPVSRLDLLGWQDLVGWIDHQRIQVVHCVPSVFRALLNADLDDSFFLHLTHVLLAGEPLLPADVQRWMGIFGSRVQIVNLYGPSETTMTKLFHFVAPGDLFRAGIPIGKPMPGASAIVVDENGKVCPPGTPGEIWIRTPYRTLGYFNRPDLTEAAFIPNPFTQRPDDLVYRTGDLGRVLEGGSFEYLGRKDRQVKIRGVRVEPAEIESRLLEHPAVADVAVEAVDGEGGRQLWAFVVARQPLESEDLRRFAADSLPEPMIPSRFLCLAELPRTATGKVDRARLLAVEAEAERSPAQAYQPPRTPEEEILVALWEQLLGVPRVGIHDDVIQLGMHSLVAAELMARVRMLFDIYLPMRDVFEHPTVARLASHIETARRLRHSAGLPELRSAPRTGRFLLSPLQERIWEMERRGLGGAVYHQVAVLSIEGGLDAALLEEALGHLAQRHAILRTRFTEVDGEVRQDVLDEAGVDLARVDHRDVPADLRPVALEQEIQRVVHQPFLADRGEERPPWRAALLRVSEDEHVLVLAFHQLVADGGSAGIINRELAALYTALSQGRPAALPNLPFQYADVAEWQQRCLEDPVFAAHLDYWRARLEGARPLRLLADRQPEWTESFAAGVARRIIPEPLYEELRRLCREQRCTLSMLLLATLGILLRRYSGEPDVVVGLPAAHRPRPEMKDLVGCFNDEAGFRLEVAQGTSFRELLRRVRDLQVEDSAHYEVPFTRVLREVCAEPFASHVPLFSVTFNYQFFAPDPLELPDLRIVPQTERDRSTLRYDLALRPFDNSTSLDLRVGFRTELFERSTVIRLQDHLSGLLESVLTDPGQPVEVCSLLREDERRQLLASGEGEAPGGLERALLEHPAVRAAVVEGMTGTVAYVDLEAGVRLEDLRVWLLRRLPESQAVRLILHPLPLRGTAPEAALAAEEIRS